MDRMQIRLALGLEAMGIEVCPENYDLICGAVYLARQEGIYLTQRPLNYFPSNNRVSSFVPFAGGPFDGSFYDDLVEIMSDASLPSEYREVDRFQLSGETVVKLKELGMKIREEGLETLLELENAA